MRTGEYNMPFLGRNYVSLGGENNSWVESRLLLGYWLVCGTGVFLIILALFRNKILGAKAN
jgi:hypothetical protein